MGEDRPLRVLLADDEAPFRKTTARLLERRGFFCEQVSSAQEAIDHLALNEIDVLVADIKMPGNDRLELIGELRRMDTPPGIILVTGYPSVDTAVSSLSHGVHAYLVKPFELDDLHAQIADAGARTRFLRRLRRQQQHLDDQVRHLDEIQHSLCGNGAPDLDQTVSDYLTSLMVVMADTALEASSLLACVNNGKQPVRALSKHPELDTYRAAVHECIAVLEKTKTAFKSKELATLRKQLQTLIDISH